MTMYLKLSTMEFPFYLGEVQDDPAGMQAYAPVVETSPPTFDGNRYSISYGAPELRGDTWYQTWVLTPRPDEIGADVARKKRNALLAESDWIVIRAFETNTNIPGAWEVYRQALRDVPQQAGFPWDVVWPTQPV